MFRTLSALCMCCMCMYASAQQSCNIAVDVIVVERHNAQPLPNVVVHIDELNATYETNDKGRVRIDSLCTGSYTFHFHTLAYEHYAEKITVKANAELKFKLAHTEGYLDEVEVAGERNKTVLQNNSTLNKEALNANSGKTIGDMLENVNGVTTIANGATIAKPVIHGLHSNRIVMLNNGIRQEDQQWGSEHAPNIDPFLANNITVIKGAAAVKYGTDAIAGVVLVEPSALRNNAGWDAELNLVGLSNNRMGVASAIVNHNVAKVPPLSFRVQGTFKQGGNYRVPNHWVANTGVKEQNYSAAVGWKKLHYGAEVFYSRFNTDLGIYSGSHTGNEADKRAAVRSDTPLVPADFTYKLARPRQHVVHDLWKTKLYLDSKFGMWYATYAYQKNFRQEYDILRTPSEDAQLNLTLNTQTLNLNLVHRKLWKLKGEVGVDAIHQQNYIQPGDRLFLPNYRSAGAALYAIERYKVNNWTVEGGVRYDYRWYEMFNTEGKKQEVVRYEYNFNNISGTLGIANQLTDRWRIMATLSNAWRAPQANEMFSAGFHHGAARIELGNKNLQPERSYNLNIETEYDVADKLKAEWSVYTQYIQNFIYLKPDKDVLTIRGYFKTFNYTQTNANLTGTDLSAAYQWTKGLSTNVKASTVFARDLIAKDWLILMPADRLTVGNTYKRNISHTLQDCFVTIGGQYVAQQKRIPQNFDDIDFPRPPAAYFLLDASIGTKLAIKGQNIFVSVTANNILNQQYRTYLDAFRYFIDQPGTNIVLRLRVPIIKTTEKQ